MAETPGKTRIDKWLWAIRFFKTRTLATDACAGGKVRVNGLPAKPSTLVKPGDEVICKKEHIQHTLQVRGIIEKRVGAPIAVTYYEDITPPEELLKFENWFSGKARPEIREKGAGRPTKKDRREIDQFKKRKDNEDN